MTYPRRSGDPRKNAAATTAEQDPGYIDDATLLHQVVEKLNAEGENADWSDLISSMRYERDVASIAEPVSQALKEYYGDKLR